MSGIPAIGRAALAAVAVLTLLAGCGAPEEPTQGTEHAVRGTFVRLTFDGAAMRVDHEAIPGVMDAMTMDFRLLDPADGEGLSEGDRIGFTYVTGDGSPYIKDVHRIDDGTGGR